MWSLRLVEYMTLDMPFTATLFSMVNPVAMAPATSINLLRASSTTTISGDRLHGLYYEVFIGKENSYMSTIDTDDIAREILYPSH